VKRLAAGTCVALLAMGMCIGMAPVAANAAPKPPAESCFPGSDIDYPPAGNAVDLEEGLGVFSGHFAKPSNLGNLIIEGADPAGIYCGTLYSAPVNLPAQSATAAGTINYTPITVPADFAFNAMHHLDIFRSQVQVGSFDFCVTTAGDIGPASLCAKKPVTGGNTGGNLPKTGTNHLMDILRAAAIALGLGAAALYSRRRLRTATA
jgi:hypothetical protein